MKTLGALVGIALALLGLGLVRDGASVESGSWQVQRRTPSRFVAAYWDGGQALRVDVDYRAGIGAGRMKVTRLRPGEPPLVISRAGTRAPLDRVRDELARVESARALVNEAFRGLTAFVPVEAPWDPSYGAWRRLGHLLGLGIAEMHAALRERRVEPEGLILWPPGPGPRPATARASGPVDDAPATASLPEGARAWCCIGGCCGTPAIGGRDCYACYDEPYSCRSLATGFTECGEICRSGDVCNELSEYFNFYHSGSSLCGNPFTDCCPHSGNHWGGWFCQHEHFIRLSDATFAYRDSMTCRGFDGSYACLAKGDDMSDHDDFVYRIFTSNEMGKGWYCLPIPCCGCC